MQKSIVFKTGKKFCEICVEAMKGIEKPGNTSYHFMTRCSFCYLEGRLNATVESETAVSARIGGI